MVKRRDGKCQCCGICRSIVDHRLARCARRRPDLAPPPPGEADIIIIVGRPDRPSSSGRPDPPFVKRTERKKKKLAHSRLQRVALIAPPASRARGSRVTGQPLIVSAALKRAKRHVSAAEFADRLSTTA